MSVYRFKAFQALGFSTSDSYGLAFCLGYIFEYYHSNINRFEVTL